jgi:DegV family protein with EDD domain
MVKIITDTTACLPAEYARDHGVSVIPQIVNFGEESYLEEVEIDLPTFMRRLRSASELPKTAAPPPELFYQEFEKLVPSREPILCIHPSSEVSGTVRSASLAARDFPEADIRVIDTRTVAAPLAALVQIAVELAEAGESVDSIEWEIKDLIPRSRVYFLVDTLEYLARGGRIGGASALLGSVLQVKPILTLREGKVESYEKERTHRRAMNRLVEIVLGQINPSADHRLAVMHADGYEQACSLISILTARLDLPDIPIYNLPPAIVVHGGPGILGASFFL